MPDYVIIGGGIYGCSVAWELAKRGADVHLLEAKTIASGASGGLGKRGVRANGRDIPELPFMRMAYDQWETLHEDIGGDTGYERTGHLLLIEREQDYAGAASHVWMQEQQGIPTRLIEADELRELEPHVSEDIIAAIYCPEDGIADHTLTTKNTAKAAQKLGAIIQEQATVTHLERDGSRVTAVMAEIDGAEVRIPVNKEVFLLSNRPAVKFVQDETGLTLPLWAILPQCILTAPIDPMPVKHLIGHASRTLAMKVVNGNQVMISGGWRGTWNPETQRGETVQAHIDGNLEQAVAVYPNLQGIDIVLAEADKWELVSVDGIPIIDRLAGAENMIVGVGWSGHGWAIAPAVSKLLADWALSGEKPMLFEPFRYARFAWRG